ncbi:phospholipase D-like domain-containing protein [Myroides odoratus]|uniref:phospholipase D n=1 Tax=Myroides odoratus TaxID=256 RepID=A0A378RLA6_MYROD|nr:phospholipase D-like domain-containing protein [Myroides odoratus]QQU02122.1 hypothetical protein I6I89_09580 [Myroides odoratus]STZ26977.1 Uncharacterised protein [Myroides odoratus]
MDNTISIEREFRLRGGFFVKNNEVEKYEVSSDLSSLFLTQKNNNSLKKELLEIIESADKVLKICSFIITDIELFEAILNKAKNTNCNIFVLTYLNENKINFIDFKGDDLTEEELENQTNLHFDHICELYKYGVFIRAAKNLHAKFVIADRQKGFITSANLTSPSLLFNTESGVYLNIQESLKLDQLFDAVYQKGSNYIEFSSLSNNPDVVLITEVESTIKKEYLPQDNESNLRFTYNDLDNSLYKQILLVLNTANRYVYLSTYSIVQLHKLPEFLEAIKKCINRNVKVFVFCRGMNYRSDHLEGAKILYDLGCKLYGDYYNHSKGVLNESMGMIFTANLDGQYGLTSGFEVGVILEEDQKNDFKLLHERLIKQAIYQFKNSICFYDLFQTYDEYEREKSIKNPFGYDHVEILIPKKYNSLKENICDYISYIGNIHGQYFFICNNESYNAIIDENKITIGEKISTINYVEKFIFKFKVLKISVL